MSYTSEENQIHLEISKELGISIEEIEKADMLYSKGIVEKLKDNVPCEIIMPYLGRLSPTKKYIEEYEANNIRGRVPDIQSGS